MVSEVVRPKDRVSLYTFEEKAKEIVSFTGSSRQLLKGLDQVAEQGISRKLRGSAVYDGIIQALHQFQGIKGRRALLVFTDGFDNSSHFSIRDVSRFARAAEVRIYLFHAPPDARNVAIQLLPLDTGGGYYKVASPRYLPEFFRLIEAELRSQYVISYQTSREPGDRDCRKIKLELAVKGLRARTMRGWCP
jgi:Ca-activated chloride channel family protein